MSPLWLLLVPVAWCLGLGWREWSAQRRDEWRVRLPSGDLTVAMPFAAAEAIALATGGQLVHRPRRSS